MRKLRDVLRLRHAAGLSIRDISRSTKLSVGGIQKLLSRAQALQLSWPLPADLDDTRLAQLFYPGADTGSSRRHQVPDWPAVHQELKRPHVTKRLLWEEYTQRYPNRCYSYSQFCDRYRHWCGQQRRTLRHSHKAGEKCFVDYSGSTVPVIDAGTGEVRQAQLFVAVLPARPYRPRDKAKAEVAVLVVQRWILARLRHHRCFSLAEVNQCIAGLLEDLNQRPFKQLPGSRRSAFEALDKPALRPLPRHPYRYVAIKPVTVNIDYHVQYRHHYYSAPHQYVGEKLDLHAGETLVELYCRQQRVATHPRQDRPGFTTNPAHMPTRHRAQHQWSPERLMRWAREMGPAVDTWVSRQLERRAHPEQAYRVCLGLLHLSKRYPASRLNGACRLANQAGLVRLKHVRHILENNRDQLPDSPDTTTELPQDHENIRGRHHFH